MSESGRFDERQDLVAQRDFITFMMIFLVILSFIYYFYFS